MSWWSNLFRSTSSRMHDAVDKLADLAQAQHQTIQQQATVIASPPVQAAVNAPPAAQAVPQAPILPPVPTTPVQVAPTPPAPVSQPATWWDPSIGGWRSTTTGQIAQGPVATGYEPPTQVLTVQPTGDANLDPWLVQFNQYGTTNGAAYQWRWAQGNAGGQAPGNLQQRISNALFAQTTDPAVIQAIRNAVKWAEGNNPGQSPWPV